MMMIDSEPGDMEEAELTPRPRKKEHQDQLCQIFDLSADNESEPFQTPLALRRRKRVVRLVVDSDADEQLESKGVQKEAMKRKRGQIEGKKEMGDSNKQVGVER
jgi:hypothetical protein